MEQEEGEEEQWQTWGDDGGAEDDDVGEDWDVNAGGMLIDDEAA